MGAPRSRCLCSSRRMLSRYRWGTSAGIHHTSFVGLGEWPSTAPRAAAPSCKAGRRTVLAAGGFARPPFIDSHVRTWCKGGMRLSPNCRPSMGTGLCISYFGISRQVPPSKNWAPPEVCTSAKRSPPRTSLGGDVGAVDSALSSSPKEVPATLVEQEAGHPMAGRREDVAFTSSGMPLLAVLWHP